MAVAHRLAAHGVFAAALLAAVAVCKRMNPTEPELCELCVGLDEATCRAEMDPPGPPPKNRRCFWSGIEPIECWPYFDLTRLRSFANLVIPPEAFTSCKSNNLLGCVTEPSCVWTADPRVGCLYIDLAVLNFQAPGVCPNRATKQGCDYVGTNCIWDEGEQFCRTRPEADERLVEIGLVPLVMAGFYRFEDGTGRYVHDSSATPTPGLLHNVMECSWVPGISGAHAINFTGFSYMSFPDPAEESFVTGEIAYQFPVLPTATIDTSIALTDMQAGWTSQQRYLYLPAEPAVAAARGYNHSAGIAVSVGTNGIAIFQYAPDDNVFSPLLVFETETTIWRALAIVFYQDTPTLYLDHTFAATGLRSNYTLFYYPATYGGNPAWPDKFYQGLLDQMHVINAAVNAAGLSLNREVTDAVLCTSNTPPLGDATVGAYYESPRPILVPQEGQEVPLLDSQGYTLTPFGELPPGMWLNTTTWQLMGVPTMTGNFTYTYTLSSNAVSRCQDSVTDTLVVHPPLEASFLEAPGVVATTAGASFNSTVSPTVYASGGDRNYMYALYASALPQGLQLDPVTGKISGRPVVSGDYVINLAVRDANGARAVLPPFQMTVQEPLTINRDVLETTVGAAFEAAEVAIEGGERPFTHRLVPGGGILPPGLELNSAVGIVSGIPTQSGVYVFTVDISDVHGATQRVKTTVSVYAALNVTVPSTLTAQAQAQATQGSVFPIADQIVVGGGKQPFRLVLSDAPLGLTVKEEPCAASVANPAAVCAIISGAPSESGSFPMRLSVVDDNGAVFSTALSALTVQPSSTGGDSGDDTKTIYIAVALAIAIAATVIFVIAYTRRQRRRSQQPYSFEKIQLREQFNHLKTLTHPEELSRTELDYFAEDTELLGQGSFGQVYKGLFRSRHAVAIKELRKNEDIDIMMQEAVVLASLKHPNIVSLVGVVTLGAPTLVVMEMLERGSLFKYLRDRSGKHVADTMGRIRFCSEISSALAYLAEQDITHRDVATRNILLSANFVCKLGDFGLARHLSHNGTFVETREEKLAIRWQPPEVMMPGKGSRPRYSTASDVWSFGVVMYEIWSRGATPYHNLKTQAEIRELVAVQCKCLTPPRSMPSHISDTMYKCFKHDLTERPTASDLHATFNALIKPVKLTVDSDSESDRRPTVQKYSKQVSFVDTMQHEGQPRRLLEHSATGEPLDSEFSVATAAVLSAHNTTFGIDGERTMDESMMGGEGASHAEPSYQGVDPEQEMETCLNNEAFMNQITRQLNQQSMFESPMPNGALYLDVLTPPDTSGWVEGRAWAGPPGQASDENAGDDEDEEELSDLEESEEDLVAEEEEEEEEGEEYVVGREAPDNTKQGAEEKLPVFSRADTPPDDSSDVQWSGNPRTATASGSPDLPVRSLTDKDVAAWTPASTTTKSMTVPGLLTPAASPNSSSSSAPAGTGIRCQRTTLDVISTDV